MSPDIMNDIFKLRENTHYNLRHASQFFVDPIHSVFSGSVSASYLVPKIWKQIPFKISTNSLDGLKKQIRKWKPANCPCRICKVYMPKSVWKYLLVKTRIIQRMQSIDLQIKSNRFTGLYVVRDFTDGCFRTECRS